MSVYTYDLAAAQAQLDELEKIALGPAGAAWAGRLVGAGLGAAAGGAAGRATADPEQKTLGTVRGALLGAGAGLLGGQFATKAGRGQAQRFGQRQLHGATGYLPGRGLLGRAAKGKAKWYQLGKPMKGKLTTEQRLKGLKEMKWDLPKQKTERGIRSAAKRETEGGMLMQDMPKSVQDFVANRRAASRISQKGLAEEGMTSIPGLVRGYLRGGVSGKLTPLQAAKMNLTAPGLAMGVGLPLAFTGQSVAEYANTGDEAALAKNLASNVGFAAGGGLPMAAAMGLGSATGAIGGLVGKGSQMALGHTPSAVAQPPGQLAPGPAGRRRG